MKIKRSAAASLFLSLRKERIGFKNHPYMVQILDSTHPRKMMICSRQVGKSVIDCVELLVDPIFENLPIKNLREIYVSPSLTQSQQFSIEKLQPMIYESDRYRELFTDNTCRKDVFLYTLKTGAQIYLRAAHRTADRVRGIPGDKIVIDELQDMLPSCLPDIVSSSLASPYNRIIETGTPKTEDNFIEQEWQSSKQHEWAVPCDSHSPVFWNYPIGREHIGEDYLICSKCGKRINPLQGKWVCVKEDGFIEGYHINQLCSALNMNEDFWHINIIKNLHDYTDDKMNNEVLGISSGKAEQLLTLEEIKGCEYPNLKTSLGEMKKQWMAPPVGKRVRWFAGVDWGEGRDGGIVSSGKKRFASYSIFVIGGYDAANKFILAHWKKFKGEEAHPDEVVKYIVQNSKKWNVERIAMDWGHGWGPKEQVIRAVGNHRAFSVYESANLTELFKWDPEAWRYTINRNEFIARLMNAIKRKELIFPAGIDEMYKDLLAERTEYSEATRKLMFTHRVDEPDDSLHAIMYCKFAADLQHGVFSLTPQ